jgi:broad specificity phosphatase PhoE
MPSDPNSADSAPTTSEAAKTILLLRHGSTDLVASCLCGQMPGVSLNENGRREAKILALRLPAIDVLVSSPLERAWETALIIAKMRGLRPLACEAFIERNFGRWTGMPFAYLDAGSFWARLDAPDGDTADNCESITEVHTRAISALNNIIATNAFARTIAVVSHSAVIRVLLTHAANIPLSSYLQFSIYPGSISEVTYCEPNCFHVLRVNE